MKKTLIILALLSGISAYSQRKSDVGINFGASYYMGDLNPSIPFYSPQISGGINYRYNFNPRYVLKVEGNYLRLSANDADFSDLYQRVRNRSFSMKLYDFSSQFEFNFLPLKFAERKVSFSPFASAGIGGALALGSNYLNTFNYIFPFAIGGRVTLGKNWSVGLQWNFRKTFNDKLDNGVENLIEPSMRSIFNNNDWYSFAGLFVTYKIFDFKGECAAYQENFK